MSNASQQIVNKAWNFAHVLRDDGLSYMAYTEQITFLLFLKMADEQTKPPYNRKPIVPPKLGWQSLLDRDGDELEVHYRHVLEELGKQKGMLGEIFKKARPEIQNPATLRRLIVDLIDTENWSAMQADVKGDIYEGLLAKSAAESPTGAGQYFTPRELIKAIVDCVRPGPDDTVCDPAAGTGGFLLAAHQFVADEYGKELDKDQKKHLRTKFVNGGELVPNTARLCIMNLYLHGIDADPCPIQSGIDSLATDPGERHSVVMTNPPFGKKSSFSIVNEEGELEKEEMSIGWPDLGELSWVEAKSSSRNKLKKLRHDRYPSSPQAEGRTASEIANFIARMNEGDIVWAANGATILGIGRVTGEYRFEEEFDFPHQRPVEWLNLDEWKMPVHEGLQSTVREIKKHTENILETERRIQDAAPPEKPGKQDLQIKRKIRLTGIPSRIQSVLDRKAQVILYGPPGTGKTFWAEHAANDLAAASAFGKRFDELDEQQKNTITGDGQLTGIVRLCCFHPAYGYEDFLEGYRPRTVDGQVTFELRDGVFKKLCIDAKQQPQRNFYLIVDEINRGKFPRIFGELLTTLEKDKRGKQIILPVSQEAFVIPKNVFLIGTMNTADRSISLLDSALRRRFGFIEMMPDGTVLRDSKVSGIPLRAWFDALNERIRQHVGRDARNLQIGHSYLMQSGSPIKEIAPLKRAIRDDIIPLLEEYCYEDYGTLAQILGDDLVDVDKQQIRHELFDDGQEEVLVQGLLAPFSEIATSSEAISSDESSVEEETEDDEDSRADEA